MTRSVLFYRHFDQYSGGQQKVFDYFSHLRGQDNFRANISFSGSSLQDETNPWFPDYQGVHFAPDRYDYLFLAGMDWMLYRQYGIDSNKPVINLIQHVRHAIPDEDVHPFLSNKAIRICVSTEVETAISPFANGPTVTIANGISIPELTCPKVWDVYIAGYKNQSLASELCHLIGGKVECQTDFMPRDQLLNNLAASRIVVVLPHLTEGFFLPALEAMKTADVTIVPDCVGNRSFCFDAVQDPDRGNCLIPSYDLDGLASAVVSARELLNDSDRLNTLKRNALNTVNEHSLAREKTQFLDLMTNVDELWHGL